MCAAAIYWAMIPKVIYGSSIAFLHDLFGGVSEKECNKLFFRAKSLIGTLK